METTDFEVYIDLLRAANEMNVALLLHFRDHLNVVRLRNAASQVVSSDPLLGARLSGQPNLSWTTSPDAGKVYESDWLGHEESVDDWMSGPDAHAEHAVFAVALWHAPDGDRLCIRLSHVAGDGHALVDLGYALAAAYAGGVGNCSSAIPSRPSASAICKRIGIAAVARRLGRLVLLLSTTSGRRLATDFDPEALTWSVGGLSLEAIGRLREAEGCRNVTNNDVLLALFLRSWATSLGSRLARLPLQFGVNLRRYLDRLPDETCNASTTEYGVFNVRPADRLFETACATSRQMHRLKAKCPGAAATGAIAILGRMGRRQGLRHRFAHSRHGKAASYPLVSNVGRLDASRLAFGAAVPSEAYVLGPAMRAPNLILVATQFGDTLWLTAGHGRADRPALDVLFVQMGNDLQTETRAHQ